MTRCVRLTADGKVQLHSNGGPLVTESGEPCDCECESCNPTVICTENTLPIYWALDVPDMDPDGTAPTTCNDDAGYDWCGEKIARSGHTWTLLYVTKVVAYGSRDGIEAPGWWGAGGSCEFFSVNPNPVVPPRRGVWPGYSDVDGGRVKGENEWPIWQDVVCAGPDSDFYVQTSVGYSVFTVPTWRVTVEVENNGTEESPLWQTRLKLIGSLWTNFDADGPEAYLYGEYVSDWESHPHDFSTASVTVALNTGSSFGCTWPEELTLVPNESMPRARIFAGCDPSGSCTPIFNDGPYGIIEIVGTLGGVDLRVCLSRDFTPEDLGDPDVVFSWSGNSTISLTCGDKAFTMVIRCATAEGELPGWKLDVTNDTDGGTQTFDLDVSIDENGDITATISELVTIFCGSDALEATVGVCDSPIVFPCCDFTEAELCCLDEIPPLVLDKTFSAGGTSIHVTAVMGWNGTDKFIGDINWDLQCDDLTPISDATWEDCEITCDGSGGFTLSYPGSGFGPWTTTADCGLPLDMEFEVFPPPVLCDTSTPNVFLPFEMLP